MSTRHLYILSQYFSKNTRTICIYVFISAYFFAPAQKEATWLHNGLTYFSKLENGQIVQEKRDYRLTDVWKKHNNLIAYISDKNTGKLKFLTDGFVVMNADSSYPEGYRLGDPKVISPTTGKPFALEYIEYVTIIPIEESNQRYYYIFAKYIVPEQLDSVRIKYTCEWRYSILDSKANNGRGKIIKKNILVYKPNYSEIFYDIRSGFGWDEYYGYARWFWNSYFGAASYKHKDNISTWVVGISTNSDSLDVFLANSCGIKHSHNLKIKDIMPEYEPSMIYNNKPALYFYPNNLIFVHFNVIKDSTYNYILGFDSQTGGVKQLKKLWSDLPYHDLIYFPNKDSYFMSYYFIISDSLERNTAQYNTSDNRKIVEFPILKYKNEPAYQDGYDHFTPFIGGKLLVSGDKSAYEDDISRGDSSYYYVVNDPSQPCPSCGVNPVKYLPFINEEPYKAFNNLYFNYYLFNMSYFEKGYRSPNLGEVKVKDSLCTRSISEFITKDSVMADSLVWLVEGNRLVSKRTGESLYDRDTVNFAFTQEGKVPYMVIRYLNCYSDTVAGFFNIEGETQHSNLAKDTVYNCHLSSMIISADSTTGYTYRWNDGSETIKKTVFAPKTYILTSTALCGSVNDTIQLRPVLIKSVFSDTSIFCEEELIDYSNDTLPHYTYEWDNGQMGSKVMFNTSGLYSVKAIGPCGVIQDTIEVKKEIIFIPNIITPNGDEKNDRFEISLQKGIVMPISPRLIIFNRWGSTVYSHDRYGNDWSAENLENGIYFYECDFGGCKIKNWLEVRK